MSERLSEKERALIEAARIELARKAATPAAVGTQAVTSTAADKVHDLKAPTYNAAQSPSSEIPRDTAAGGPESRAARVAAILAAEREESMRRRARTRVWGIYVPIGVLAALIAWAAITLFRRLIS